MMSVDVRKSSEVRASVVCILAGAASIMVGLWLLWGIGAVMLFVGMLAVAYAVAVHEGR